MFFAGGNIGDTAQAYFQGSLVFIPVWITRCIGGLLQLRMVDGEAASPEGCPSSAYGVQHPQTFPASRHTRMLGQMPMAFCISSYQQSTHLIATYAVFPGSGDTIESVLYPKLQESRLVGIRISAALDDYLIRQPGGNDWATLENPGRL